MEIIIKEHNCRGGRGDLFYHDIFQFGRCAKTGDSVEEGGVPHFIVIYSRLEGVKKRGSGWGERGVFFQCDIFQFGRCAKTGTRVEGGGVPYFIVIYSSLEGVRKRGLRWFTTDFLGNYHSYKKMLATRNMYFDEIYNFYWKHFFQFFILAEINAKNHDFYGFLMISPWKSNLRQFSLSIS